MAHQIKRCVSIIIYEITLYCWLLKFTKRSRAERIGTQASAKRENTKGKYVFGLGSSGFVVAHPQTQCSPRLLLILFAEMRMAWFMPHSSGPFEFPHFRLNPERALWAVSCYVGEGKKEINSQHWSIQSGRPEKHFNIFHFAFIWVSYVLCLAIFASVACNFVPLSNSCSQCICVPGGSDAM